MDLQTIASRTGVPVRTLRYVMDHKIVPNVRARLLTNEVGRPRVFADDFGVGIACAALLLEAGVRRETVTNCIKIMAELNTRLHSLDRGISVATVIEKRLNASVQFGDGKTGRLFLTDEEIDSGWITIEPVAKLGPSYQPTVMFELPLGHIIAKLLLA